MRSMNRKPIGFTLIELLVVVAIIVLLISMLVPALERAMEQAMRAKCASQLKLQMVAMKEYVISMGKGKEYPPSVVHGHWPDGAMTTIGFSEPGPHPPAGQIILFTERLIVEPDALFCPSKSGWRSREMDWGPELQPENPWQRTNLSYPYFTGNYRPPGTDITSWAAINAQSPAGHVVITDNITIDSGHAVPRGTQSHSAGKQEDRDADDVVHKNAPAGGNILTNDGGAYWLNFGETRMRFLYAGREWYW